MKDPVAPIAWGELFDKITILEIKEQNARTAQVQDNIKTELDLLKRIAGQKLNQDQYLSSLCFQLKILNQKIWDAEDALRQKEADQCFDAEFIALARSIYRNNDFRASLKKDINLHLKSSIIEEKIYKTLQE